MGADHMADENGIFEMEITLYNGNDRRIGHIYIDGLEPYEKLNSDILMGTSR